MRPDDRNDRRASLTGCVSGVSVATVAFASKGGSDGTAVAPGFRKETAAWAQPHGMVGGSRSSYQRDGGF